MSASSKSPAAIKASSFRSTTIGAICDEFGGDVQTGPFGSQLHASDYNEDGIPVVMPQDMVNGRIVCDRIARVSERHVVALKRHKLLPGDLIFSRRGDVTRFALVTARESGWLCGTGSIRIRMNSPEVLPEYAKRYLQQASVGRWLLNEAKGITMPNLNTKIIRALPFVIPSIKEQRRIAALLDQAETLRTQRRTALALLDSLTQSLFLDMFGDPVANPKGFHTCLLGDIIEFVGGSQPAKEHFSFEPSPDSIRLVQIRDFRSDEFKTYIPRKLAKRFFEVDDVMIGRYGPPVFQIFRGLSGSYNVALMKALPKAGVLRDFIFFLLQEPGLYGYVVDRSTRTAGQSGVNLELLENYPAFIPPLPLQQTFATRIASIEALKATHRRALAALDALFASLQQRAFAGQL